MKFLIVDDHPLVRDAMREHFLQIDPGAEVLEAHTGAAALEHVGQAPDLDLILLDHNLPDTNGLKVLAELRAHYPMIPVVMLSADENRDVMMGALEQGASGFISKSLPVPVMLGALRLVLSGGVYLPVELLDRARRPGLREHPEKFAASTTVARCGMTPADLGLGERQSQVLALLIQGKPNKVISRELDLSEATVKAHVSSVLRTLQVSSRSQVILAATRLGLRIDPES